MLLSSIGAAALIASPDLLAGPASAAVRAGGSAASSTAAALRSFFVFGITGPVAQPGPSILSARPPALRSPAPVSLGQVADHLAALPVKSPDGTALALARVSESSAGASVTVIVTDTASGTVASKGTLPLSLPTGTSLLVTPVFTADATTVALVLSITVPTNQGTATKTHPQTGQRVTVPTATWTSHHALAYYDRKSGAFTGPFDLADAPSLALVSATADASHLYLWTVDEAAAVLSGKAKKGSSRSKVTPRLAAYPIGTGQARYTVDAPGGWPTGTEPIVTLPSGDLVRLVNGQDAQLYSAQTGQMRQVRVPAMDHTASKQGAVTMQALADGTVFINNPAFGQAAIVDPQNSFATVHAVSYPRPAVPIGGPDTKAALSADGRTLYVLGGQKVGGLSAYDMRTGAMKASYSHGENYTAVYQTSSGAVLAISPTTPQMVFFNPALAPIGSADTELHVSAIY